MTETEYGLVVAFERRCLYNVWGNSSGRGCRASTARRNERGMVQLLETLNGSQLHKKLLAKHQEVAAQPQKRRMGCSSFKDLSFGWQHVVTVVATRSWFEAEGARINAGLCSYRGLAPDIGVSSGACSYFVPPPTPPCHCEGANSPSRLAALNDDASTV